MRVRPRGRLPNGRGAPWSSWSDGPRPGSRIRVVLLARGVARPMWPNWPVITGCPAWSTARWAPSASRIPPSTSCGRPTRWRPWPTPAAWSSWRRRRTHWPSSHSPGWWSRGRCWSRSATATPAPASTRISTWWWPRPISRRRWPSSRTAAGVCTDLNWHLMARLQRAEIPMVLAGGMLCDLHWHLLVTPNARSAVRPVHGGAGRTPSAGRSRRHHGGHPRSGRRHPLPLSPRLPVGWPPAGVAQGHRPDDRQPTARLGRAHPTGPTRPPRSGGGHAAGPVPGRAGRRRSPGRWWTHWPGGPAGGACGSAERSGRGWPAGAATTVRAAPSWRPRPAGRWTAPSSSAARWWPTSPPRWWPAGWPGAASTIRHRSTGSTTGQRGPALSRADYLERVAGGTWERPAKRSGSPSYRLRQWSEQK